MDCFEIAAITHFLLAGKPPSGTGDGCAILAREFSGDVIAFCGVWFMAETAKVLNPGRIVVVPDREASCFADATAMRDAWREAAAKAMAAKELPPWWRRWLTTEVHVAGEQ